MKIKFKYILFIYFAGDGPYGQVEYITNTPVNIGHEIDWDYDSTGSEGMHLKVSNITHRDNNTILYCGYDDIFSDEYLLYACGYIGMSDKNAAYTCENIRKKKENK